MTSKRTADILITISRNLSPAACRLAHTLVAYDESLPPQIKNGLIVTLLRHQRIEPTTRLGEIVAELLILSLHLPKSVSVMKRSAAIWEEIDRMEARPPVCEVFVWWAVVRNIVDADPDLKNVTVH